MYPTAVNIHDLASKGDCNGVRNELRGGVWVDERDETDYTPLACAAKSSQADQEMLRLLIDAGADVDAFVGEEKHFPLELAACSGSVGKVQALLAAGADVNLAAPKGYTALIKATYALYASDQLVPIAELLLKGGADIDAATEYGESPLSVAYRLGRFDVVHYLLEVGANPASLRWSPLMRAIALGSHQDVERLLADGAELLSKDRFDRTPLLLAVDVGDIRKIELIHSQGASLEERGRMGETALTIAAAKSNSEVVRWLLQNGAQVDAGDDSGNTALMVAAGAGATDCVRLLLNAAANPRIEDSYEQNAMKMASNEAIARLLIDAGEDIVDANTELKRTMLGLHERHVWTISKSDYASGCRPKFGKSNPEVMEIPFWHEMVKAGASAYWGKARFDDAGNMDGPVWSFHRFGMSFTELPDGRVVQIGGEHEDSYDPDFCIYNEVVVHDRSGQFTIMGYPKEVFPPTDFHSATYLDGFIYLVGRLGYHGERHYGATPVYRLDCQTWQMEVLPSFGDNPGWLYGHRALLVGADAIVVSGGTILRAADGEEQGLDNEEQFRLDLRGMQWTKL